VKTLDICDYLLQYGTHGNIASAARHTADCVKTGRRPQNWTSIA